MTLQELYKWAVKNDCEDKQVVIYAHDNEGAEVKNWLDEDYLDECNECVSIDCTWCTWEKG
ncbi:hypothetical protein [uncultured Phascolarctobacterium sp.]|uniref:hypothetical protein n=1 Tax=uncultured Phascolarctobacterium sp. TaxID=512296 RepID=UPI0025FFF68F|nr:hypothetical protein [uncultured Phascolarctobacterium sp.]